MRPLSHRIYFRHEYKSCPIIDYYRITPLFMSSQLAMLYLSDWASAMMVMEINIIYTYHVTFDLTNPENGHGKKINTFTHERWGELERSTSKPYPWEPNFIISVFIQWLVRGRLRASLSLRAASVFPWLEGAEAINLPLMNILIYIQMKRINSSSKLKLKDCIILTESYFTQSGAANQSIHSKSILNQSVPGKIYWLARERLTLNRSIASEFYRIYYHRELIFPLDGWC